MESRQIKEKMRREILAVRDSLPAEERQKASLLMTERLCGHQWFYLSEELLAFVNFDSEIDTTEVIREALRQGKKVYAPRVEGEDMSFYRIESLEELVDGYQGILEPDGSSEKYVYDSDRADKTLMMMPGIAFDRQRNRLGHGKGFYDRFLAVREALQQRTIALGFCCQLVEEIPAQPWDVRPAQVLCL